MKIYHGSIVTCDSDNRVFTYLAEDKGRIVYTGNELPAGFKGAGETIELGNRALLPSFGDAHAHFSNWALVATIFFDPRNAQNFDDIGRMLVDFSRKNSRSKILAGFGLSPHSLEEKRLITREELDRYENERPVYLICYDGHSAVINTKMLSMFPDSVRKIHGFDGEAGHVLYEAYYAATDFVTKTVPPLELVKSIKNGFDLLSEKGIGTIHPVEGIGFPMDLDVSMVAFIAKAHAQAKHFNTRLFFQTMDTDKVLKRGLRRIGGCFATALDGCFGRCDAALLAPYSNDGANKGILFYSDEQVFEFVKRANREGLQIEFHAIGDAAVDQALRAFSAALEDFPRKDHRHTIIHACLAHPEHLEICAKLGIGITLQPAFLASPLEPREYLETILGKERVARSSPLRTMVEKGIHLSGGSDAPVTPPDPIEGLFGACNHPYDSRQSLSIAQALRMFTYEIAWTGFDEKDRGTLETGKVADMTILSRNPLEMKPEELRELEVEQLILSGKPYKTGMNLPAIVWHSLTAGKAKI